jgi:hypothetical protein
MLPRFCSWIESLAKGRKRRRRERRRAAYQRIIDAILQRHGPIVQAGPFAGLIYPTTEAAGSALAPKLFGTYERELHDMVERVVARGAEHVGNVGCGEGYYAVGLALRLPNARVSAFDTSERAQRLCQCMAEANGVASRVVVAGECDRELIRARFAETHTIRLVRYQGRNPAQHPEARFLPPRERKIAVGEFRKRGREWALLTPLRDSRVAALQPAGARE